MHIGNCDVCGFQFKLKDLRDLFIRTKDSHVKACKECWNTDHPTESARDVSCK